MKLVIAFLGIIGFLVALVWFVLPIAYVERTEEQIPFFVLVFAIIGYYGAGLFVYKTYKDRVIKFIQKLDR